MKYLLFLLFWPPFLSCFAQEPPQFDKIIISYDKGGNSWGRSGIYSRGEEIILIPKNSETYKIEAYLKTESTVGDDGNTFSKDTVSTPIRSYKISKVLSTRSLVSFILQKTTLRWVLYGHF